MKNQAYWVRQGTQHRTRVAHSDASRWDYGYAGRNRLETATRYNSQGGMVDYYYYAYDDADNMLQNLWWNGV
jgi:hypothetical protein